MEIHPIFLLYVLGVILACIGLGFLLYGKHQKLKQHPNIEWKKHVNRLRSQGIDPSYIKRSPEWDRRQNKKIQVLKYWSIFLGIVIPIGLVIGLVIVVLIR
jgi:hypothetical protein